MTNYIICHKKRNTPRLSVTICEEKCPHKDQCKEYLAYSNVGIKQTPTHVPSEATPVALGALS